MSQSSNNDAHHAREVDLDRLDMGLVEEEIASGMLVDETRSTSDMSASGLSVPAMNASGTITPNTSISGRSRRSTSARRDGNNSTSARNANRLASQRDTPPSAAGGSRNNGTPAADANYAYNQLGNIRIPGLPAIPPEGPANAPVAAQVRRHNGAAPADRQPDVAHPAAPDVTMNDLGRGIANVRLDEPIYMTALEQQEMILDIRSTYVRWCELDSTSPVAFVQNASPVIGTAVKNYLDSAANAAGAVLGNANQNAANQTVNETSLLATKNDIVNSTVSKMDQLLLRGRLTEEQREELLLMTAAIRNAVNAAISVFINILAHRREDLSTEVAILKRSRDLDAEMYESRKMDQLVLKLFISKALNARNYKRGPIPDYIYAQVSVGDYNTRFWRPLMPMLDFINELTKNGPDRYFNALNNKSVHMSVVAHFRHCDEFQFSTVKPVNGILSFRNGIYNLMEARFLRYDAPAFLRTYPAELCSYNLLDADFPDDGYDPQTGYYDWDTNGMPYHLTNFEDDPDMAPPGHFMNIVVPFLTAFLNAQRDWDWRVRKTYCWAMGRCQMYIRDAMQCFVILFGDPGKGKSKAAEHPRCVYPRERLGELMAMCQREFAGSDFLNVDGTPNKDVIYVADCDGFINMDPNQLFAVASNELATFNVKHALPRTAKPALLAPFMVNTNKHFGKAPANFPSMSVSQFAAFYRRAVTFPVDHQPAGEQPTPAAMEASMGYYVKVVNLAYHEFNRRLELMKQNGIPVRNWIWDHIPKYLSDVRQPAFKEFHFVCRFLFDSDWFVNNGSNAILSVETIRHASMAYVSHRDNGKKNYTTPGPYVVASLLKLCFDCQMFTSDVHKTDAFSGRRFKDELYVTGFAIAPFNSFYQDLVRNVLPAEGAANSNGSEESRSMPPPRHDAPLRSVSTSTSTSVPVRVAPRPGPTTPSSTTAPPKTPAAPARSTPTQSRPPRSMEIDDLGFDEDDDDDPSDVALTFQPVAKRSIPRVTGYDDDQ